MRKNIPSELREISQWVCAGEDKRPYNPSTLHPASVTDPTTWASFETACATGAPLVGFVLSKHDPYTIIDLDDKPSHPCTPEQAEVHRKILAAFESYTERSAGGRGHHIIVRGTLSAPLKRDNVEAYSRDRYMVCTGNVVRNAPIVEYQHLLNELARDMTARAEIPLQDFAATVSDDELYRMASTAANANKFNPLWSGAWAELGYPSQSEADYGLLSMLAFYSRDNEQVRRMFHWSGLARKKSTDAYLDRCLRKIRAKQPQLVDTEGLMPPEKVLPVASVGAYPETIQLSTVPPRKVDWLWPGRLAKGELTVMTGRPGAGKGLLLSHIAGHYTQGKPMYASSVAAPPGNVLWISVEDAMDTSLAPRAGAAGADKSRIFVWNLAKPLSLPNDAGRILAEIKRLGCTLAFIDPAPTLLDKDHSSNNDANVRQSFAVLSAGCRDLGCTLLLVRHTNKRGVGDAMDRGGGSIGWSGMARVELMLGRPPAEEDDEGSAEEQRNIVHLATVKNNLGKWAPTLQLQIQEAGDTARLIVVGESTSSADDLCAPKNVNKGGRPPAKREAASELLQAVLGDGEWHPHTQIKTAALLMNVSLPTLDRACNTIKVEKIQMLGAWHWRLQPASDHQRGVPV